MFRNIGTYGSNEKMNTVGEIRLVVHLNMTNIWKHVENMDIINNGPQQTTERHGVRTTRVVFVKITFLSGPEASSYRVCATQSKNQKHTSHQRSQVPSDGPEGGTQCHR